MSTEILKVSDDAAPEGNSYGSSCDSRVFEIDLVLSEAFRTNTSLIQELAAILAPSYEDPSSVLRREIDHCTHLYLGRIDEEITCFFLVSWEHIELLNGSSVPSIYMGLSAARQDKKNSGQIRRLYVRVLADGSHWERQQKQQIILWATMATPTSYLFSQSMLQNVEPCFNGTFSKEAATIAQAIRLQHGYGSVTGHPFVLKGVAMGTLYSDLERDRITQVLIRKKFNLFEHLNIQEHRGDRLLMIANTPTTDLPSGINSI